MIYQLNLIALEFNIFIFVENYLKYEILRYNSDEKSESLRMTARAKDGAFYLPARAKRSGDIIRIIRKNELKTYH